MKLDLNCDLGEGEPAARTRALMRRITSANVACGGHAGDAASMEFCVRLAKQFGVRLGAHPGPWSRLDLGRSAAQIKPGEIELLLLQQVGALEKIARDSGLRLHHIKLHGALYHASETDEGLARRYLESVTRWWPGAIIYAKANGNVARLARKAAIEIWEEGFIDRGYKDDGALVPRNQPGALVTKPREARHRARMILEQAQAETISGRRISLRPRTLCVHSDTPNALALARIVRLLLDRSGALHFP
ncbi:MAG: LamB/YcsF family protein [Verrucomicrobia bacterium]|nr:LamB/YcsF family protein [Verrucomicrobiota bacterium]